MIKCRHCNLIFPAHEIKLDYVDGKHYATCKDWVNQRARNRYRKKNKIERTRLRRHRRQSRYKRLYGDQAHLAEARYKDGSPCDICGQVQGKMAIDHCHDTGMIRGKLCGNCNTALGLVNDDPKILLSMLGYLEVSNVTR